MRFIPVDFHNILDYVYGTLIVASPWFAGFADNSTAAYVAIAAGIFVFIISLITNYKYSAAKIVAFNFHLKLDMFLGIFLLISPWLLGFSDYVYIPHVVFGLTAVLVSLTSKRFVNYKEY